MHVRFTYVSCLLLCCCLTAQAQNLVSNPSFENYNACPPNIGEIKFSTYPSVTDWVSVGDLNTPDYFNVCGGSSVGVPNNTFGWQPAHTGDAYAGILLVTNAGAYPDHGEYLQCRLSQPMQAGHQYAVSCYVSRANTNVQAGTGKIVLTDQLGIVFSQGRPISGSVARIIMPVSVANTPGNYLRDTNWVKLSWIYTATGGEEWMTIGNFEATMRYITYRIPPPTVNSVIFLSYLYFDDFCVTDIGANTGSRDTILCNQQPLALDGPPGYDTYVWNTGDTTGQLTVHAPGTYWVRGNTGCSFYTDTIRVTAYAPSFPDLGNDTFYCDGTAVTLSSKKPLLNYSWNTGDTTASIPVIHSGWYVLTTSDACGVYSDSVLITFTPPVASPDIRDTVICQYAAHPLLQPASDSLRWYAAPGGTWSDLQPDIPTSEPASYTLYVSRVRNGCESALKPVRADILNLPVAALPGDTTLCTGARLTLGVSAANVRFRWNTGDTVCCIAATAAGTYSVEARNRCGVSADSVRILVDHCEQCLWAPSAFTPNGDGRNDVFRVQAYCTISRYRLVIVNRWGQEVFGTSDVAQSWDGSFNNSPAAAGVYYFFIEALPDIPGGKKIIQKGDITLIR